jgi:hypothetical protein
VGIQWDEITSTAYLTLIELGESTFPISLDKMQLGDVSIVSFQDYSKKTGASISDMTCDHEYNDAICLREIRPGISLILYNDESYDRRLKHTLWHEIGHIKLNHKNQGRREEIEAHFFAAQANAPNVLIRTIAQRGYEIDVQLLMNCFELSNESANKKMEYLKKYNFDHTNPNDDLISQLFASAIDEKYPLRSSRFEDDYFDDMESRRENW